jgi:hypothetical protein
MSTKRFSGSIEMRITYIDPKFGQNAPNGGYRCFLKSSGGAKATIYVVAPPYLSRAVDSPEAFDDAARAAIVFADDENDGWVAAAAPYIEGTGYHVGRSPSAAWPKESSQAV